MPRDAPSSDRVLLLPEGRREPRPHAAPGRRPLPRGQRGLPLLPADLADQRVEHVVDVVAVGGGRLEEGAAELAGQSQPFLPADLRVRRTSAVTREREGTSSMGRERLAAGGEAQRGGRHAGDRHTGGPSRVARTRSGLPSAFTLCECTSLFVVQSNLMGDAVSC